MKKFREGSLGAKERKGIKVAKIIMSISALIVFMLFYVFNTDMKTAMIKQDGILKVLGVMLFLSTSLPLILERKISERFSNEVIWGVLWFVALGLAMLTSIGWDI